jgi:hypothetical protein
MKLHGNARTCPKSRKLLVCRILEERWSLTEAAAAAGVSERTACKWVGRFKAEGEAGLFDRSSAPKRIPHRTSDERIESIKVLRKLRMTAVEIAEALGMALSTCQPGLSASGSASAPGWSRPSRRTAMSAATRASSSTLMSRSSGASAFLASASSALATPAAVTAGSAST